MRLLAACALLGGCGRYAFQERVDASANDALADVATDVSADAANACAGFELCDGFESGLGSPWMVDPGASVDTTVAHRGAQSVHFQSVALNAGQGGYYRIFEHTTLPLGDTTFYVRAFFRFGSLPAGTNGMELIAADQLSGSSFGDFLFLKNQRLQVYEQFDNAAQAAGAAPALDTWLCVQWTVTRSTASAGSVAVAGDGGTASITNVQTDGSPAIMGLDFGIGFSGTNVAVAQPAMDIWMDDIIVDKAPVTCAQ